MYQTSARSIMQSIIPISRFASGEADKIFDEVSNTGVKIVIRNDQPACVLLSPKDYDALIEMLSDQLLLSEAEERMRTNNDSNNLSHEDVLRKFGITEDELSDIDVEIE